MVSEFDNLKDKAQQYAQDHPEQVDKAEAAVEDKLGMDSQEEQTSREDPNTPPPDQGA
jgi:hypothetical protein